MLLKSLLLWILRIQEKYIRCYIVLSASPPAVVWGSSIKMEVGSLKFEVRPVLFHYHRPFILLSWAPSLHLQQGFFSFSSLSLPPSYYSAEHLPCTFNKASSLFHHYLHHHHIPRDPHAPSLHPQCLFFLQRKHGQHFRHHPYHHHCCNQHYRDHCLTRRTTSFYSFI